LFASKVALHQGCALLGRQVGQVCGVVGCCVPAVEVAYVSLLTDDVVDDAHVVLLLPGRSSRSDLRIWAPGQCPPRVRKAALAAPIETKRLGSVRKVV